MKKKPYLSLVLVICGLVAVAANTVSGTSVQQTGMSVWGEALGVHSGDTLMVCGNLHLFTAHVQGSGTLLMADTTPCHIFSEVSSLPHLVIDNTDTVVLHGELHLRCGLSVVQGTFDTRAARLLLADSAFVQIFSRGAWLQDTSIIQWLPTLPFAPLGAQKVLDLAMASPLLCNVSHAPARWRRVALPIFISTLPPVVWVAIPYPPPRLVDRFSDYPRLLCPLV
jgi:hypothetical protein